MRLNQIQSFQNEITAWNEKNFPNNKPHQCLLGLGEEMGELMHAHLKMEQGIRGDQESLQAEKVDAVGDIFIYLCAYCSYNGIDLDKAITTAWDEVANRDWEKYKQDGVTDG